MKKSKKTQIIIYDPIHDEKGQIVHNWNLDKLLLILASEDLDLACIYSDGDIGLISGYVDYSQESIIKAIKIVMSRNDISIRKLSKRMKLSPSYVCSFLNMRYTKTMRIYTLERICRALKVPVFEVLLVAREIVDSQKQELA